MMLHVMHCQLLHNKPKKRGAVSFESSSKLTLFITAISNNQGSKRGNLKSETYSVHFK